MPRIILASASPRRQALVAALGLEVEIRPADVDETPLPGEAPIALACRLAQSKTAAIEGEIVLGADTVVVCDGEALGKPASSAEAATMLKSLRGRAHSVVTGIALRLADGEATEAIESTVWMRSLSDAEIRGYVESGLPFDKAGSYGIQDDALAPIERVEGCYLNVVGLPLCAVGEALSQREVLTTRQDWFGARDWRRCSLCRQEWPRQVP